MRKVRAVINAMTLMFINPFSQMDNTISPSNNIKVAILCVHSFPGPQLRGCVMNYDIILHGGHAERQTMSNLLCLHFFYYHKILEIMPEKTVKSQIP